MECGYLSSAVDIKNTFVAVRQSWWKPYLDHALKVWKFAKSKTFKLNSPSFHSNLGRCQENSSAPLIHSFSSSVFSFFILLQFFFSFLTVINNFQLFTVFSLVPFPFVLIKMAITAHQCPENGLLRTIKPPLIKFSLWLVCTWQPIRLSAGRSVALKRHVHQERLSHRNRTCLWFLGALLVCLTNLLSCSQIST